MSAASNRTSLMFQISKRSFDVTLSLAGLLLLLPVWPVVAAGVFLSDGFPILYRARRAGLRGRSFTLHKFRTMRVDTGQRSRITAGVDPRVFPFGAFMRRTKLDELPQLFDILRGEMSIVGPRPEDATIVEEHYRAEWFESLSVRPGLTSPGTLYYYSVQEKAIPEADAEEYYFETILPEKMALDIDYVRNASLGYDIRICLKTAWLVIRSALKVESR